MREKDKNLVGSAALLSASAIVAKLISAAYRIPLTNVLGAEGIGTYQLIFPVYALLLALAGGGVQTAVSRLTAERVAVGENGRVLIRPALIICLTLSAAAIAVLTLLSGRIARLQGNAMAENGFKYIAVAVLFVSAAGVFKGWFQGNMEMRPTAAAQLVEQVVKLAAGLTLSMTFLSKGIIYAVYGAVLGIVLSEFASFIFVFISYLIYKPKTKNNGTKLSVGGGVRLIGSVAVPILIGSLLLPIGYFIDSILIVNLLKGAGESTASATADYGLWSGTVMSVVNVPVVLSLSLAVAVVPAVSRHRAECDLEGVLQKSATSVKLSYVIGVPAALLFFALAEPITQVLYPRLGEADITTSATLLRIASLSLIFTVQAQIYTALLQALGKASTPVAFTSVSLIVRVVLLAVLLPRIGIVGAAVALVVSGTVNLALGVIFLNKLIGKNVKLIKNVSEILLSGVIITIISLVAADVILNPLLSVAVALALSGLIYVVLLALFKVFDDGELDGLPLVGRLSSLAKKFK